MWTVIVLAEVSEWIDSLDSKESIDLAEMRYLNYLEGRN